MSSTSNKGDGKWEVVGSSKSKAKLPPTKKNGIPVLTNSKSRPPQSPKGKGSGGGGASGGGISFKPGKMMKPPAPDQKLIKLASEIQGAEIIQVSQKMKETFPNTPLVWCKEVADFLNTKLDTVKVDDSVFQSCPSAYPLDQLPKPALTALRGALLSSPSDVLEVLLDHCVKSLSSLAAKGQPSHGYQMVVQVLAQNRSKLAINAKLCEKYLEVVVVNKNQAQMCLSILWALGQCGMSDYKTGLQVWADLMMPVLGIKSLSPYCADYLEWIMQINEGKPQYDVFSMRQYFQYFDGIFRPTANVPSAVVHKLHTLYPSVKEMSFGESPQSRLHLFFPSFIARLESNVRPQLKTEVLDCLVACISTDPKSLEVWKEAYSKCIPQTGILLSHIMKTDPKGVDHKALVALTRYFARQNAALGIHSKEANDILSVSETIHRKKRSGGCCWGLLRVFFFTTLIMAGLAYVVYSYKPGGTVDQMMDTVGIDRSLMLQAQKWLIPKIKDLQRESNLVIKRLEPTINNFAVYITKKCEIIGKACAPYVTAFNVNVLQPFLGWASQSWSALCQWVSEKDIWGTLSRYIEQLRG